MSQLTFYQISLKMNFRLQFKGLSQAETGRKGLTVLKHWLETERAELTCSIPDVLCQDRTILLPFGLIIQFSILTDFRIEGWCILLSFCYSLVVTPFLQCFLFPSQKSVYVQQNVPPLFIWLSSLPAFLCAINSISIYYVFDLDVHIHSTELNLWSILACDIYKLFKIPVINFNLNLNNILI